MAEISRESVFTPDTLRSAATAITNLHGLLLTDVADDGADPIAEEYYLSALAYLELAYRTMRLAGYAQSRALADVRR